MRGCTIASQALIGFKSGETLSPIHIFEIDRRRGYVLRRELINRGGTLYEGTLINNIN